MAFLHHARRRSTRSSLTYFGSGLVGSGLALLAALASPAAAQNLSLQSGDNLTVSAAGTQGIYQGKPISNATTAYTSSILTSSGSKFTLSNGGAITSSGAGLDVYGGNVLVNGGTITGQGAGSDGIYASGGTLTITGGNISGIFAALSAASGSTTQILGGNFSGPTDGLAVFGGDVAISGGTFSGGNAPATLVVASGGVLDLFGTFNGNGNPITSGYGTITGTLLDGQAFSDSYFVNSTTPGSQIEFNVGTPPAAVPELSSAGSLGVGLAFLGVLGAARRRRARQAASQLGQQ